MTQKLRLEGEIEISPDLTVEQAAQIVEEIRMATISAVQFYRKKVIRASVVFDLLEVA